MQLLHRFQRADALDGWLQRAWGDALAAAGRVEEAAKHYEARTGTQRMNFAALLVFCCVVLISQPHCSLWGNLCHSSRWGVPLGGCMASCCMQMCVVPQFQAHEDGVYVYVAA